MEQQADVLQLQTANSDVKALWAAAVMAAMWRICLNVVLPEWQLLELVLEKEYLQSY